MHVCSRNLRLLGQKERSPSSVSNGWPKLTYIPSYIWDTHLLYLCSRSARARMYSEPPAPFLPSKPKTTISTCSLLALKRLFPSYSYGLAAAQHCPTTLDTDSHTYVIESGWYYCPTLEREVCCRSSYLHVSTYVRCSVLRTASRTIWILYFSKRRSCC